MPPPTDPHLIPPSAMPVYLIRHATLRQLQVFEAIVRLGSFTRAAEELFLTQPTVSMHIRKMSEAMGLPLFEHVGRNVKPTEAGVELYDACRRMFETLANLEMKMADLKGMRRGRLRLGVITTAKYFASEILGEFCRLYPGIEVALKVTNRDRIVEGMLANEDDLYIMGQAPCEEIEVEEFPVAPNPLVVMAPRDHPLVGQKRIPFARIAEEPFLLREPGSGIRDATLKAFDAHGLRPKVRMELGSNEAIKHAVVGGLGLSVLSLHSLTLEGTNGPVAVLDVEGFPTMRQWYLVYPKGKELSLVARTFLEFAIASEPRIRTRMESLWPGLQLLLDSGERLPARKSAGS
ncbi:LysR family transcriptional regulator [Thioalkalivibrio paradoxus ARh 1]|uniref:LysR family transcriptional regulator n=1 Tax=Thioalkalivibrio paradoxus ARh 1 TaxID=713585 RepID=W0DKC8_9GAMM|nr:LysR family transcriptional regulator [Thioalkalivibrio paradoxus ARh 1]